MNIVISENNGMHIAVICNIGVGSNEADISNIITAIEDHFDSDVQGHSITEVDIQEWISNPWGMNKDYSFYLDIDEEDDNRTIINIQTAVLYY